MVAWLEPLPGAPEGIMSKEGIMLICLIRKVNQGDSYSLQSSVFTLHSLVFEQRAMRGCLAGAVTISSRRDNVHGGDSVHLPNSEGEPR